MGFMVEHRTFGVLTPFHTQKSASRRPAALGFVASFARTSLSNTTKRSGKRRCVTSALRLFNTSTDYFFTVGAKSLDAR
jgi:hypothetical protein